MLITLSQCDFNMGKTLQVYEMNEHEKKNYKKLYEDIGKGYSLGIIRAVKSAIMSPGE